MINSDFNSVAEILNEFPDEAACIAHLEALRWSGIVVSPFDPISKVYACKNHKYRCRNTGKYFNARTSTIFSSSRIGLQKWFAAIWIVSNSKKRITSTELSKELNLTQKTAWYMLKRLKSYLGREYSEDLLLKATSKSISPRKIAEIDVTTEIEKLQMTEWLQLLKTKK